MTRSKSNLGGRRTRGSAKAILLSLICVFALAPPVSADVYSGRLIAEHKLMLSRAATLCALTGSTYTASLGVARTFGRLGPALREYNGHVSNCLSKNLQEVDDRLRKNAAERQPCEGAMLEVRRISVRWSEDVKPGLFLKSDDTRRSYTYRTDSLISQFDQLPADYGPCW